MRSISSRLSPSKEHDLLDRRRPEREGAGLVEDDRPGLAELLDGGTPLDDHADLRRPRDAGENRDRSCEDERTGRGDDEHGEGAYGIAAQRPGEPGEGESDRQEEGRIAVGHSNEGRLVAFRVVHEANDGRVCALRGRPRRAELEDLARVRRPAANRGASLACDGQGFACQGRLVQHRLRAGDEPVDGDDLAVTDENVVAGGDVVHRHLLDELAHPSMRNSRCSRDQRPELAPRSAGGGILESVPTGEHESDDRPCQVLA